jgi:RES domain-containing protein
MAPEPHPRSIEIEDVYFRYSSYDVPFWVRPNTTEERWNGAEDGPTQYLSATTDGSWAELIRNENLRSESDLTLVQIGLWQARIGEAGIADYRDFKTAEKAGLDADVLVDDDQTRCRMEGRRLRQAGFRGVLYPSAALPGETNLALFGPRILLPWGGTRLLSSGVPGMLLTVGAPPAELLPRTRHLGAPHAGLTEHRRKAGRRER